MFLISSNSYKVHRNNVYDSMHYVFAYNFQTIQTDASETITTLTMSRWLGAIRPFLLLSPALITPRNL